MNTIFLVYRNDTLTDSYAPEVIEVYTDRENAERAVEALNSKEPTTLVEHFYLSFEVK